VSRAGRRLGSDLRCPETGKQYVESGPDQLVELVQQAVAIS
jgi:hypothetical protein